ncbi:hypothetical protein SeMB42_g03228 [Synchytrium endobioticum]|uniref:Type 1 phosphatases regulator n=1 Tax=Synchytrium endobioticum TaxID=286115 RepID=A0A507D878_9FUNG|nr:hypothetical protein SeLEV6574_g05518 [Synchytrium endobioticum]TPX47713.1 hypothetical protein SeMB42_g03228 [Synchytrium endobioticum]
MAAPAQHPIVSESEQTSSQRNQHLMTASRERIPAMSSGSQTITIKVDEADKSGGESSSDEQYVAGTLRLQGGDAKPARKVKWRESVIDNEGMDKKKSNLCCIYHKPYSFDDSDSSDYSTSDEDDPNVPNRYERKPKYKKRANGKGGRKRHSHQHYNGHVHHPECDGNCLETASSGANPSSSS